MAIFRFKGDTLHMSIHGSRGQRGKVKKLRFRMKDGSKVEQGPSNGKQDFDVGDEIEVTDTRVIRHLKIDPRFELVSE